MLLHPLPGGLLWLLPSAIGRLYLWIANCAIRSLGLPAILDLYLSLIPEIELPISANTRLKVEGIDDLPNHTESAQASETLDQHERTCHHQTLGSLHPGPLLSVTPSLAK